MGNHPTFANRLAITIKPSSDRRSAAWRRDQYLLHRPWEGCFEILAAN